jgi:protein SHQ1
MITPLFTVEQDADTVTVRIRAPFSRPRDFDIATAARDFHFHCRPYLLHLAFPHPLRPVGDTDPAFPPATASYDFDAGIATVTLAKGTPGLTFPALSCVSTLLVARTPAPTLTPRPPPAAGISLLSSCETPDASERAERRHCTEGAPRRPSELLEPTGSALLSSLGSLSVASPSPSPSPRARAPRGAEDADAQLCLGVAAPTYGFADRYSSVLAARGEDAAEIVELQDPDTTPASRRRGLRLADEVARFDPEHYVADFMLASELDWVVRWPGAETDAPAEGFSVGEQDVLVKLPRREYLDDVDAVACADLAGVLFAACYDLRAGAGERTVESAWTISRIAPALSWLEHAEGVEDAVRAAYARSLVYPLYRNLGVANAVLGDVKRLFRGGAESVRESLLRVLLDVRDAFENAVVLRIFSDIFFTDYCVWIQRVGDDVLAELARKVAAVTVPVASLPWDLMRLQKYAVQVDAGETPDDSAAVWLWGGQPGLEVEADRREVQPGQLPPSCASDARPPELFGGHAAKSRPPPRPEVIIAAPATVRSASFGSLEDFGMRPVSTQRRACGRGQL